MKQTKVKSHKSASGIMLAPASVALLSSLLIGCGDNGNKQEEATGEVKVKVVTVGESDGDLATSTSGDYRYSGTVEEENGVSLSFLTGGTITQLKVKMGDRVHKGQLIAAVDPTSIRNSYEMACATKEQAEDAFRRMKQLHDKGSLPEIKWVETQSQLQQAVSAENIARKSLNDCNLYAPFDGVISEKYAEVGQIAAPGMPIVKLVTTAVLNVKISVPESEMANIHLSQRARIMVQALNNRQFEGTVVEKGVIADPISRSYSVKVRINDAPKDLLPGMVTSVSLDRRTASSAVVIPARLIQLADDNSNFVWIDKDGKAVRRTIVCDEYRSNGVSIASGLKNGDKLIVEGQQKVCTGTPLKTEQQ